MCDGKKCSTCEHRLTCTGCPDKIVFADTAVFDKISKTIQSVRDGVYEYLGAEIGMEPKYKIFKVYRSPETVKKLSVMMNGLPLTDGHVPLDKEPGQVIAHIKGTELEEFVDEDLGSTVIIKHRIDNSDSVLQLNKSGKNELSLGFKANLIEHDQYDFEQTEFEPHHLAILERGRCGTACRFIDKKPEIKEPTMKKLNALMQYFSDQEGEMTLQQLMEMVAALPEAIRSVPMEELNRLAPSLKEIIDIAQSAGVEIVEPGEAVSDEEAEATDEEGSEEEVLDEESKDEEAVEAEDEEPSDEEKLAMADGVLLFSDAQAQARVDAAVIAHSEAVEHARKFVDEAFDFTGKTTSQIHKEVVEAVTGHAFEDSAEAAIAFRLLKSGSSKYTEFGDASPEQQFDNLKNKDI